MLQEPLNQTPDSTSNTLLFVLLHIFVFSTLKRLKIFKFFFGFGGFQDLEVDIELEPLKLDNKIVNIVDY